MFLRILWSYIEYFFNAQIENDKITYFLSLDIRKDEIWTGKAAPEPKYALPIWSQYPHLKIKYEAKNQSPFLFILVIRVPYFLF